MEKLSKPSVTPLNVTSLTPRVKLLTHHLQTTLQGESRLVSTLSPSHASILTLLGLSLSQPSAYPEPFRCPRVWAFPTCSACALSPSRTHPLASRLSPSCHAHGLPYLVTKSSRLSPESQPGSTLL